MSIQELRHQLGVSVRYQCQKDLKMMSLKETLRTVTHEHEYVSKQLNMAKLENQALTRRILALESDKSELLKTVAALQSVNQYRSKMTRYQNMKEDEWYAVERV
jgi:hypothetical protein